MPFHGNFPTEADYLFERDRDEAKQLVRDHYPRIHVPDVKPFDDVRQALDFLKSTEQLWVLKGQDDSVKTFVPDVDDPNLAATQIIETLKENKEAYDCSGFILEELINPAIEITPEKIYYDGVPLAVVVEFENKPFGSGNISIQTGCSQNLLFPIEMGDKINGIAARSTLANSAQTGPATTHCSRSSPRPRQYMIIFRPSFENKAHLNSALWPVQFCF
jgi:hypothetical protein